MNEDLARDLRDDADWAEKSPDFTVPTILLYEMRKAADVIVELNKKIDFLMNCIYEAEDSLDRGAHNDWARAALEKAERGKDDV